MAGDMQNTKDQPARPVEKQGTVALGIDAQLLTDARHRAQEVLTPALAVQLADYRRELASLPGNSHYKWFTPSAHDMQANLLSGFGGPGFAAVHAMLMIEAIEAFDDLAPSYGYPPSILERFRISYRRILTKIAAADWAGYDLPRDLLWKDFGLAMQRLMPGGARVIEPEAWLPRSLLIRGGVAQGFRAARLFLTSGHGPYLNLHTHDFELGEFNEAGWRALMLRLADLLRARPWLKGMFVGGGWLYDPQLPQVSPRLAYHRGLTIPNGAETFFYAYDGPNSYAFSKSETRRRLNAEGKYRPELHVLVWRRKPLLAWADAQSS